MRIILDNQFQMIDSSLLVLSSYFETFGVWIYFDDLQHIRFSLCSVVHLNELAETNEMRVQFDDVLFHIYMSVHMNDRV